MKFLFVVFLLINGEWVRGDTLEGWASMEYQDEVSCLAAIERAKLIQLDFEAYQPARL